MPIGGEDSTSEYRLTEEDIEGDLDMPVPEDVIDQKSRPLIDWVKPVEWLLPNAEVHEECEEDEEDEDADFIDLYESGDEGGNGSEDSEEVYGEGEIDEDDEEDVEGEQEDVEGEQEDVEGWEEGDDNVHMRDEGETFGSGLGSRMRDLGGPDSASSSRGLYGDAAEHRFRASPQEIGERLLGPAMTPMDFFTSPEDEQDSIENIVTKRKRFLAGYARLIIDLEAATREDAEEQGIAIEEMDRIDREMDRQAHLNMASQHFPHRVKQEPEHYRSLLRSIFFSCYLLVLFLTSHAGSAFLTLINTVPLTLPYLHSHFCIYPPQYLTFGLILSPYSFSHIISPGLFSLG